MAEFILAIRRSMRDRAPANWRELVEAVPGVEIKGRSSTHRMYVDADPESLAEIQRTVGQYCIIEPVITHDRQGPTDR